MLKKYFLLFITFFLLPLSSGSPLLNSKQLDDNLLASGRSGGGRHSSSRSHHSSSRSRHSHSHTSSSRSHRTSRGHYSSHGTKTIPRIRHPMHVYPGYTPDSTVIYGGTPLQTEEGIPSFADKIPNPVPQPTPQASSTSDQNDNTSLDTTTIHKDDQTPKTSTIVKSNKWKWKYSMIMPMAIRKGLYDYCWKKYYDKNEQDPLIKQINFSLIYICYGEMVDKYDAMLLQNDFPQPPDSTTGGPSP